MDPSHLDVRLTVNGQERQHSNTCYLIFSIPFIIAYLSQAITLEPGDVISTGTPPGVGPAQPGDEIKIKIQDIGILTNRVI